jgi:Fe2+ or Zn2+ uptake regulation protein
MEIVCYLNILLILIINKKVFKELTHSRKMSKLRNTTQKNLLETELLSIQGFFTAEEFYKHASKKNPAIGIATIYRFLNDKKNKRHLHSYICDKHTVYSNNSKSHCHYTCQICEKKEHIEIKDIGSIKKNIKGSICHFQIDVTGVCEECQKKKSTPHHLH